MILCDTNILIEFYKANPSVIQTLLHIGSANIAVSVITKAELFFGARDKQEHYEKIAIDTLKASLFNIIQFERKWCREQRAKKKQGEGGTL